MYSKDVLNEIFYLVLLTDRKTNHNGIEKCISGNNGAIFLLKVCRHPPSVILYKREQVCLNHNKKTAPSWSYKVRTLVRDILKENNDLCSHISTCLLDSIRWEKIIILCRSSFSWPNIVDINIYGLWAQRYQMYIT